MGPSSMERSETGQVCRASSINAGRILRPIAPSSDPIGSCGALLPNTAKNKGLAPKSEYKRILHPLGGPARSHLMKGWLSEMDGYREVKDGMEEVDLLAYHHLSHGIDFCHGKGMKAVRTGKDWTFNDPTREYLQSTTPCSPLHYEEKGATPLFINSGTLQLTGAKGLGHNATDLKKLWLNPIKEANATGRAEQWFNHPHLRDTFPIPSLPLLNYKGGLDSSVANGRESSTIGIHSEASFKGTQFGYFRGFKHAT
eukprot:Gb_02854 [translate_table: standard]